MARLGLMKMRFRLCLLACPRACVCVREVETITAKSFPSQVKRRSRSLPRARTRRRSAAQGARVGEP